MSRNYKLSHDQNAVTHIQTDSLQNFAYALGFSHARERGMQLGFYQALVRSELSQTLKDPKALKTDQFMAKMGFYFEAKKEATTLAAGSTKGFLKSYCEGVNEGRRLHKPWEFSVLGHEPSLYAIEDILALFKTITYLGLAQTQQDMQKFIAMSLAKGVSPLYFESLLGQLTKNERTLAEVIPYLQKTQFDLFQVSEDDYLSKLPNIKNSNNWVVKKEKTDQGGPLVAFDPHMNINHLPCLWFETVWKRGPDYTMGITLPGLPVFFMGRNQNLSFSFTYGYMDTVDYFIEKIDKGQIKGPNGIEAVNKRTEILKDHKKREVKLSLFETQRGLLEVPGNPKGEDIKDGIYLARAWTGQGPVTLDTLQGMAKLATTINCEEACELTKDFYFSANWLFADRQNNISLQQSGEYPSRKDTGLIPMLAWDRDVLWSNKKNQKPLLTIHNPPEGYLISANQAFKEHQLEAGEDFGISIPMADYRYKRIKDFLESKNRVSLIECQRLQSDLYSYQAKSYMDILRKMIPETPTGRILKQWDLTYHQNSKAAFLFEKFLETLYFDLMGLAIGESLWVNFTQKGGLLNNYYGLFDRLLLSPNERDKVWFHSSNSKFKKQEDGESVQEMRDAFLLKTLKKTLSHYPSGKLEKWGKTNQFSFQHLLFKGPRLLPWNIGPVALSGSRATVNQGNVTIREASLQVTAPSYRFLTSMEKDQAFSVLPGGPSDRFYKASFKTDLKRYLNFQYKSLFPG